MDGLARLLQLAVHALAGIEDDAHRERGVLAGKLHHRLLGFIVENAECAAVQPDHRVILLVGDADRNQHQVAFGAEIGGA